MDTKVSMSPSIKSFTTILPHHLATAMSSGDLLLLHRRRRLLLLHLAVILLLPTVLSAATLTVTPTTLTPTSRTVHLTWTPLPHPSPLDWLGIYSPPSSPDDHFIGYLFLPATTNSLSIPLVNLRQPYSFRLFTQSPDEKPQKHHDHDGNPLPSTKNRVAVAGPVGFEEPGRGEQVHLSFTDREDEMRVVFVMGDGGEGSVRYGVDEGVEEVVGTEKVRYGIGDMCAAPANSSLGWRDPGWVHGGVMKGLKKGTKYYYKVGSDTGGWSATHSFISRNSDSNETIAFLFGDMGTYAPYNTFYRLQDESISTVKWILRDMEALGDKPAFVSHIGDISYARGFSWIWDEFFNQIEPIASRLPYHVCIGNHEYDWPSQPWRPSWSWGVYGTDGGGECGVPYSLKFKMPGNSSTPTGTGSPDTRNLYYSFNEGVVHFLYISTETNFLKGSDQYNFIKADLESVNRDKTPFIVVQGHRPMYTTSNELRDAPMRERMLENLEPLLVENNVTLALWGHVHRYERFCPMKNYTCLEAATNGSKAGGAPIHVVIGMAGQDWQPIWEPRPTHPDVPIFPQPERSMYRGGEFGYTKLVATREKLTLTYIGNHDGEMHDIVEIPSAHYKENDGNEVVKESTPFSLYVQAGSILLLGSFVGYALGFVTRCRKDSLRRSTWIPVKVEET